MPSATFEKLAESKRNAFIAAFLEEFAQKSYEEASISTVVKKLGIAKGSVYQYFENKMDLFLYLKKHSEQQKSQHAARVNREDYPDFWAYLRVLYEQGIEFDAAYPLEMRFLYNLQQQPSKLLKPMLQEWQALGVAIYTQMMTREIERGAFRQDLLPQALAHFILAVSEGISKRLIGRIDVQLDGKGGLLKEADKAHLMQLVDEQIILLRAAFQPLSTKH
jgi:AcrR family transcriptional regulator